MFAHKIPPNFILLNIFENNSAEHYGQDYGSEPFRILFLQNQSEICSFFFLSTLY